MSIKTQSSPVGQTDLEMMDSSEVNAREGRATPTVSPTRESVELRDMSVPSPNEALSPASTHQIEVAEKLDTLGVTLLAFLHASSSASYRLAEFAFPLYLVHLFPRSLLPASIFGFLTTLSSLLFSGSVGVQIDKYSHARLRTLRVLIAAQKSLVTASYALFIVFLASTLAREDSHNSAARWILFAATTLLGCGVTLANNGVNVSVERDWVSLIARGKQRPLTKLNAIMRRIDLLTNLVSPLFVSLLTATLSYKLSAIVLSAFCAVTALFELCFSGIIYRRFSAIGEAEHMAKLAQSQQGSLQINGGASAYLSLLNLSTFRGRLRKWASKQLQLWSQFMRMPVFPTVLSISMLYMTVLSFDSTFLAYLKSETDYSDPFIAGMRAASVVAGLLGTVAMPLLSRHVDLVRCGSYSILSELASLVPVLLTLWHPSRHPPHPARWNTAVLFTFISLSRIGLWSFDLTQLTLLQTALDRHTDRNALFALQSATSSFFDLGHYALTLGWSRPDQFRYPATVSVAAVALASATYLAYARRERGHLVHLDQIRSLVRKKRV